MLYMYRFLSGGADDEAPHEERHFIFSDPNPAQEPTCDCGARLDAEHPDQCRKCAERAHWLRRGGRLVIMRGKSKTGNLHSYYFCLGRHATPATFRTCISPASRTRSWTTTYSTITLPSILRDQIRARMDAVLTDSAGLNADLCARVAEQLAALNSQEDQFLDLVGNADWPQDKIAARLRKIPARAVPPRPAARRDREHPARRSGRNPRLPARPARRTARVLPPSRQERPAGTEPGSLRQDLPRRRR